MWGYANFITGPLVSLSVYQISLPAQCPHIAEPPLNCLRDPSNWRHFSSAPWFLFATMFLHSRYAVWAWKMITCVYRILLCTLFAQGGLLRPYLHYTCFFFSDAERLPAGVIMPKERNLADIKSKVVAKNAHEIWNKMGHTNNALCVRIYLNWWPRLILSNTCTLSLNNEYD